MKRVLALLTLPALAGLSVPSVAQAATPLCWGQPATIVGTVGNDTLVLDASKRDVIYMDAGDDRVSSTGIGTAPDLLCGGPGNDTIAGGPGPDKINGGDGGDYIVGLGGADVLQGNAGDDQLDDRYEDYYGFVENLDKSNDSLRGGIGNDRIWIGFGIDKAYGQEGNDSLHDTECTTSYLYGGPGDDYFHTVWSYDDVRCVSAKDYIYGETGTKDYAQVNSIDAVTGVETRVVY